MSEQWQMWAAIGGTLVTAIGGPPAIRATGQWIGRWLEKRAKAKERLAEKVLDAEHRGDEIEATTIRELFDMAKHDRARLAKIELHVEDCELARITDRKECDERVSRLERKLEERTADMTGRIRTEVRRSISSQGVPVQREVHKSTKVEPEVIGRVPPLVKSRREEPHDE